MQYSQQIVLKNGSIAVLRNGVEAHGSAVLENFNRTHAETDYLLRKQEPSLYMKRKVLWNMGEIQGDSFLGQADSRR